MGRTQEALERAEREYLERQKDARKPVLRFHPVKSVKASYIRDGLEQFQSLKVNLLTRYPNESIKTIIFCSTDHGDGATTTATNFAAALTRDCEAKVLLVDINLRTPYLHEMFNVKQAPGFSDYIVNGGKQLGSVIRAGSNNFSIIPCGSYHSVPLSLFQADRFNQFLKEMQDRFDYVILDAPPLPSFSESRIICPKVDGVVLVVAAGKTRRQVALRAKQALEESGGRVLGVVINRRKYYVPEWIYKRL
jgi:capsular exopolysaccharide synthesis family protein